MLTENSLSKSFNNMFGKFTETDYHTALWHVNCVGN